MSDKFDKIDKLGDAFRGLWQVKSLNFETYPEQEWCVTFLSHGEYVETPNQTTKEEALDYAINYLRL